jgi:aquaporin Z
MFPQAPRRLVAEFIGAFALTFIGAGAIMSATSFQGYSLIGIAAAHGLVIGVMVCAFGHVSGGHFNPAVSAGMLITGRMTTPEFVGYVVAQCAAAILAALILAGIYDDPVRSATHLGVPALAPGIGAFTGLVVEAILTFFLVVVIFGVAVDPKGSFNAVAGLPIGFAIFFDILMGGPLTGAAMNPSRWIGPAVVDGFWDDFWIYIVGPIAGGIAAALVYEHVIVPAKAPSPAVEPDEVVRKPVDPDAHS